MRAKASHRIDARPDCGAGPCAELPGAADQARGAVRRRRSGRHRGPPAGAGDEQGSDRRGRERQRRRRQYRRDLRVPRGARRLHAAVSSTWDGDQPVPLLQARIRSAGFRNHRHGGLSGQCADHAPEHRAGHVPGFFELSEGQSRKAVVRQHRPRRRVGPVRDPVQERDRDRHQDGALSRHRAGADRYSRRQRRSARAIRWRPRRLTSRPAACRPMASPR